jgi:hypothetical protein
MLAQVYILGGLPKVFHGSGHMAAGGCGNGWLRESTFQNFDIGAGRNER